jgi:hypothetical protein
MHPLIDQEREGRKGAELLMLPERVERAVGPQPCPKMAATRSA